MCVQEEERLKHEKLESTHLATHVKENARKGQNALQVKKKNIKHNDNKNKTKCFFCKKEWHMKKACLKYKKWLEKKGNLISLVCHESVFVEAPNNTWWVDSGSTIHIVNSMQGFLNLRKPKGNEQCIYSGNRMC